MQRFLIVLLSVLLLVGCDSSSNGEGLRIGIDAEWVGVPMNAQAAALNGFVEEVLLEVSRYSGLDFVRVRANWDALYEGLREKKYDAVISSLPRYTFNTAKYDFSKDLLDVGAVLVVPVGSKAMSLEDLAHEIVGMLANDSSEILLQKVPSIIPRNYPLIPDLFNALMAGQIEGILLDRLVASAYVRDLYARELKIIDPSLDQLGLHLIAPKDSNKHAVELFDKSIKRLQKSKRLDQIAAKWNLQ